MTRSTRYRPLIGVCVLMLYAFISTPVQLWHHHPHITDNVKKETVNDAPVNKKSFNIYPALCAEENCYICEHHYSLYGETELINIPFQKPAAWLENSCFYIRPASQAPASALSNKGPPLI
ncbi:MAG: hypothetical protein QM594_17685 [Niabella sp.]